MPTHPNAEIGPAYDRIAREYDIAMLPDMHVRRALWRHYRSVFVAGDPVLDFGCGTGTDAVQLSRYGLDVSAIDASPAMIKQASRKAREANARINVRVGSTLAGFSSSQLAGIVSAFAALNTVPDLQVFAEEAHGVLRPRGRLVAHMLAPPGIWEIAEGAVRGGWAAGSVLRRRREHVFEVFGRPVLHVLLPPRDTYNRFFAGRFRLLRLYALGFLWPQALDPRIGSFLGSAGTWVEQRIGGAPPFSRWGRFFVLDMERRGSIPNASG